MRFKAQLINGPIKITMNAGETATVTLDLKNIGQSKWSNLTRLGTANSRDRFSPFFSHDWIQENRVIPVSKEVRPGQIERFTFTISAPNAEGLFVEDFDLVQEGVEWFNNPFQIRISVLNPKKEITDGKIKILYLSCHETLEYYDVSNLRKLGFDVFVVGHNTFRSDNNTFRKLSEPNNPDLQRYFNQHFIRNFKAGQPVQLNFDFVNKFDFIINAHWTENMLMNWDYFKHKPLIYRSIASFFAHYENFYEPYRKQGMKIIRLSPAEKYVVGYIGEDASIRTSLDPDYYKPWIGNNLNILTVNKMMNICSSRMRKEYEEVTDIFKNERILCGKVNGDIPYSRNEVDENELNTLRQNCRVYFALCTKRAPLVYTFSEALMAGMPVVTFGKKLIGYEWFEQPDFIENGVSGFYSDTIQGLQDQIRILLNDYDLAKSMSIKGREIAIKHFSSDVIQLQWKEFFKNHWGIQV